MLNLIKNEFVKLFSRKVVYIFIVVTALFMLLMCYLNSFSSNNEYDPSHGLKDTINTLEIQLENTSKKTSEYYSIETQLYMTRMQLNNEDTWVLDYLEDNADLIYAYHESIDSENLDPEYKENLNKEFLLIDETIKNNDWESFVNSKISKLNVELDNLNSADDKKEKEAINYEISMLNKRLKDDIAFNKNYISIAINDAVYNKYEILKDNPDAKANLLKAEYVIENEIDAISSHPLKSQISGYVLDYGMFIIMFALFISGTILSNEFSKGTIKSLLVVPYSRSKILLSKFITVIIATIMFALVMMFCNMIIGIIFYGVKDLSLPVLIYNNISNKLIVEHTILYSLIELFVFMPTIIFFALVAFVSSIIISNSGVVIALTFIASTFSEIINIIVIANDIKFMKYFITLNYDFTAYLYGGTNAYEPVTFGLSLIVYSIYFIIIAIFGILVFNKKNIKNI